MSERIEVTIPRGRLWIGAGPDVLGDLAARTAIDVGSWIGRRSARPGAPVASRRFAALRSALHTASGGSYFVFLAAMLEPGEADWLDVQVAIDRAREIDRFEAPLAEVTLAGACAGAEALACAGRLQFRWAQVHPVDCKPHTYAKAGRTLAGILAEQTDDARQLAARAAALWAG